MYFISRFCSSFGLTERNWKIFQSHLHSSHPVFYSTTPNVNQKKMDLISSKIFMKIQFSILNLNLRNYLFGIIKIHFSYKKISPNTIRSLNAKPKNEMKHDIQASRIKVSLKIDRVFWIIISSLKIFSFWIFLIKLMYKNCFLNEKQNKIQLRCLITMKSQVKSKSLSWYLKIRH